MEKRSISCFQSPIHRGNPCIRRAKRRRPEAKLPFSPLFIGAILASLHLPQFPSQLYYLFQSPIHRGNPCIASSRYKAIEATDAFSPLFIGAILASQLRDCLAVVDPNLSVPYSSGQSLHHPSSLGNSMTIGLSVPYSSGQSLHPGGPSPIAAWSMCTFQSPIHRGNPCIPRILCRFCIGFRFFQSPIHRGNPCIPPLPLEFPPAAPSLSVPYSSGQSLHHAAQGCRDRWKTPFQSPIHRGNPCIGITDA